MMQEDVENDVTEEELRLIARMEEEDRLRRRLEELKNLQSETNDKTEEMANLAARLDHLKFENTKILDAVPLVAPLKLNRLSLPNDNNELPDEVIYPRRVYKRRSLEPVTAFTYEPWIAGFEMRELHPLGFIIFQKIEDTVTIKADLLLKLNDKQTFKDHEMSDRMMKAGDFALVFMDSEVCPHKISRQSLAYPIPVTMTCDQRGEDSTAHQLFASIRHGSDKEDYYYLYFYYKIEDAIYDVDRLSVSEVIKLGPEHGDATFSMLSFNFGVVLVSDLDLM